jgi:hypothetical protein
LVVKVVEQNSHVNTAGFFLRIAAALAMLAGVTNSLTIVTSVFSSPGDPGTGWKVVEASPEHAS